MAYWNYKSRDTGEGPRSESCDLQLFPNTNAETPAVGWGRQLSLAVFIGQGGLELIDSVRSKTSPICKYHKLIRIYFHSSWLQSQGCPSCFQCRYYIFNSNVISLRLPVWARVQYISTLGRCKVNASSLCTSSVPHHRTIGQIFAEGNENW